MKYLIKENEKAWVVTASNNEEATNWAIGHLDMSKKISIELLKKETPDGWKEIEQYRAFVVRFLSPTNTLGSRIKITDKRSQESVTVPYDYSADSTLQTAFERLKEHGFKVVGYCDMVDYYVILADNWGENFISLKNLKS